MSFSYCKDMYNFPISKIFSKKMILKNYHPKAQYFCRIEKKILPLRRISNLWRDTQPVNIGK